MRSSHPACSPALIACARQTSHAARTPPRSARPWPARSPPPPRRWRWTPPPRRRRRAAPPRRRCARVPGACARRRLRRTRRLPRLSRGARPVNVIRSACGCVGMGAGGRGRRGATSLQGRAPQRWGGAHVQAHATHRVASGPPRRSEGLRGVAARRRSGLMCALAGLQPGRADVALGPSRSASSSACKRLTRRPLLVTANWLRRPCRPRRRPWQRRRPPRQRERPALRAARAAPLAPSRRRRRRGR